jgi:hypothetical protein
MRYPRMQNVVPCTTALAVGLLLQAAAFGHGGQYRGPGGTIPPGGRGGSVGTPGPTPAKTAPRTGRGGGADLTAWTYWWGFNKEPFLNLKAHVHAGGAVTGNEGWSLGRGQRREELADLRPHVGQVRQIVVPALEDRRSNRAKRWPSTVPE